MFGLIEGKRAGREGRRERWRKGGREGGKEEEGQHGKTCSNSISNSCAWINLSPLSPPSLPPSLLGNHRQFEDPRETLVALRVVVLQGNLREKGG
jgi:hypothetical protein